MANMKYLVSERSSFFVGDSIPDEEFFTPYCICETEKDAKEICKEKNILGDCAQHEHYDDEGWEHFPKITYVWQQIQVLKP